MDIKSLMLVATKNLYLDVVQYDGDRILSRWVTSQPHKYEGFIRKGDLLVFSHIYEDNISFIDYNKKGIGVGVPDFLIEEIQELIDSNVLEEL